MVSTIQNESSKTKWRIRKMKVRTKKICLQCIISPSQRFFFWYVVINELKVEMYVYVFVVFIYLFHYIIWS